MPIGFPRLSFFGSERANSYLIKRHSYNLIRLVPALMNFLQKICKIEKQKSYFESAWDFDFAWIRRFRIRKIIKIQTIACTGVPMAGVRRGDFRKDF